MNSADYWLEPPPADAEAFSCRFHDHPGLKASPVCTEVRSDRRKQKQHRGDPGRGNGVHVAGRSAVGLDIGTSGIRAAEVTTRKGQLILERYGSLFQMTSDVEGRLRQGIRPSDLIRAVFPPGSITGAPKIRAMEIIDELEHESRGVYCGCIGYLRPDGDCLFNVAIRTIVQRGNQCEMGIGSGIVADSDPQSEFNETLLKGEFVKSQPIKFKLLETIAYRPGSGYSLMAQHLTRMRHSAEYFGWRCSEADLQQTLDAAAADIVARADELASGAARVRLLLDADCSCRTEWADAGDPADGPVRLVLSCRQIDPADIFLYHKTTRRQAYDAELREARERGFFDALHINTRGELTECCITNIIVEIDGEWYTPPLDCGLLPGIWRAQIRVEGKAAERVLTLDDLHRATRVTIGNSVRGAMEVESIVRDRAEGGQETLFCS